MLAVSVEAACREGVNAAGGYLAQEMSRSLNLDVFTISGECKLRDTRNMPPVKADKIEDGVWNGELPGTFEGQLF